LAVASRLLTARPGTARCWLPATLVTRKLLIGTR
jgi:hypothetical protein